MARRGRSRREEVEEEEREAERQSSLAKGLWRI